jgi:large repetitive protein
VLLTDWSRESVIINSGFSEAVADENFAAMVALDQMLGGAVGDNTGRIYDAQGNLIRRQGDLFNSALHFIGFSRGTVVNSEIIQRLGTYFPHAGGRIITNNLGLAVTNPDRDLQMTTIDPHDFEQENLNKGWLKNIPIIGGKAGDYSNFYEPPVRVWSNVTFADNYYQTRADANSVVSFTPNGREIQGAVNKNLTDLTGFRFDNNLGNTHTRTLAWYAGTLALNLEKLNVNSSLRDVQEWLNLYEEQPIYDALGGSALIGMRINSLGKLGGVWYDHAGVGEGIGEGWAYSTLGGGRRLRPTWLGTGLTDVRTDNTATREQRGDFAVPTIFNGNFDAVLAQENSQVLPSWIFEGNSSLGQNRLKTWAETLLPNSPDRLTYADTIHSNYAINLKSGDRLTHRNFVVPDWGALRFDLYTQNATGGSVKIFLDGEELLSSAYQGLRENERQTTGNQDFSAVDLTTYNPYVGINPKTSEAQSNRIGYGTIGFQTFQVDIPNKFRGKAGTLKFQVDGATSPIYLDNVFFQSKHLLLGNPSESRKDIETPQISDPYFVPTDPNSQFKNNYLIERPQYTLSYNNDTKTANWVSYQLNNSWVGDFNNRSNSFQADPRIPFFTNGKAVDSDIPDESNYNRGHMTAAADRSRNQQDYFATFLMSNVLPQPVNEPNGQPWTKLEEYLRDIVKQQNKEVYIVAGRYGEVKDSNGNPIRLPENKEKVSVPDQLWKMVLILDRPGLNISDITADNAIGFAITLPNSLVNIRPVGK